MMPTSSLKRHSFLDYSEIIQKLISKGRITPMDNAVYIYNYAILKNRLDHLKDTFFKNSLHAVAIKSNAEPKVLNYIAEEGYGLEAASFEEVILARKAGCANEKIVFDSPVKTNYEIQKCNAEYPGIKVNANCFEELDRLKDKNNVSVGIRINPLLDIGSPGIYNVSGNHSKFGIPIDQKERIIEYALKMKNCKGLHIHAGSEIGNQENHTSAIASVVHIAEQIRSKGKKLEFVDIGGGIPPKMKDGTQEGLENFFVQINTKAPQIKDYQIITEFGRFTQSHTAFVASRVEYILDHCQPNIALTHVGADLFPREIYSNPAPFHQYFVLDRDGKIKNTPIRQYDIGGPLCFSGDFLAKNLSLPEIEAGDYIIVADTGANSISMWSQHCNRKKIKTIYIDTNGSNS